MRTFLTWLIPMAPFALWFAWREGVLSWPEPRGMGTMSSKMIFPPPEGGVLSLLPGVYGNAAIHGNVTTGAGQGVYIELQSDAENITITGNTVQSTQWR